MKSSTEAEIASFIAKYTPEIAAQLEAARARLRKMFPRGREPAIRARIEQAIVPHAPAFAAAAPLRTLIKSVSAKQRARRPSTTGPKR